MLNVLDGSNKEQIESRGPFRVKKGIKGSSKRAQENRMRLLVKYFSENQFKKGHGTDLEPLRKLAKNYFRLIFKPSHLTSLLDLT